MKLAVAAVLLALFVAAALPTMATAGGMPEISTEDNDVQSHFDNVIEDVVMDEDENDESGQEGESEEDEDQGDQEEDLSCASPNAPASCTNDDKMRALYKKQIAQARKSLKELNESITKATSAEKKQKQNVAKAADKVAAAASNTVTAPVNDPSSGEDGFVMDPNTRRVTPPAPRVITRTRTIYRLPDLSGLLRHMFENIRKLHRKTGNRKRVQELMRLVKIMGARMSAHQRELVNVVTKKDEQIMRLRRALKSAHDKRKAATRSLKDKLRSRSKYYRGVVEFYKNKSKNAWKHTNEIRRLKSDVATLEERLRSAKDELAQTQADLKAARKSSKKTEEELENELKFDKFAKTGTDEQKNKQPAVAAPTPKKATNTTTTPLLPLPPAVVPAPPPSMPKIVTPVKAVNTTKTPATGAPPDVPQLAAEPAMPAFDRLSLQGQVLAQAACTAMNPRNGWVFAVQRTCSGTSSCADVCGAMTESQAGGLSCLSAVHVYADQPTSAFDKTGLKTFHYGNCNWQGCGPNFCCCTNKPAAASMDLELAADNESESVENQDLRLLDDFDLPEIEEQSEMDVEDLQIGTTGFNYMGLSGQLLAQSTCVALNKEGAWTYAVPRECSSTAHSCETLCASLSEQQGGKLSAFNALHVYAGNKEANAVSTVGLKTYIYHSVGGRFCGPNYCCCRASGARMEDEALEEDIDENDDLELAADLGVEPFLRTGIDGAIQAEAVGTALMPLTDSRWVFSVHRRCTPDSTQTCAQVCSSLTEAQVATSGNPIQCIDSLHIYGNQPTPTVGNIGLKTYRYNSCSVSGCGPSHCLCSSTMK